MTIYEFIQGEKIVRVQPSKTYSSGMRDRSFMGEGLEFVGIANGCLYCRRTDELSISIFGDRLLDLSLDLWDEGWEKFIDPTTLLNDFKFGH